MIDKFVLIVPNGWKEGYQLFTRQRFQILEHIFEAGYLKILSLPPIFMGEVYHESLSPDVYLIVDYDSLMKYIHLLKIILPMTDVEL